MAYDGIMSHSHGEVWSLEGELLGHFEYNGNVDVACSRVYLTCKEMEENWRADNGRGCLCNPRSEQNVILWTSYGNGFHWPAKVCMSCMAITDGCDSEGSKDGHPFFEKQMLHQFGESVPCPHCKSLSLRSDGDQFPIRCDHCGRGWYEWEIGKESK